MKLTFLKRRGAAAQRQPNLSRSIPVDRYYSGASQGLLRNSQNNRDTLRNTDRSRLLRKRQAGAWVQVLARWGGVLGIVSVLLFNTTLNQVGVKVSYTNSSGGNQYRSDQEYIEHAQAAFHHSPFYRSKLTFNAADYEQLLAASLPETDLSVAVVPLVGTKLQVGLSITEPLAHVPMGGGTTAIVGANGKLLEVSDNRILNELIANTPALLIEPAANLRPGTAVLTSGEVHLIQLILKEFDGSAISRPKLDSFRYSIEKRELHITFTGKSYYAKFTTERDGRLQVGALIATLKDLNEGRGAIPAQYIDVRVDGRVFVL